MASGNELETFAEAVTDGVLCKECGELFEDMIPVEGVNANRIGTRHGRPLFDGPTAPGHPRTCEDCKPKPPRGQ